MGVLSLHRTASDEGESGYNIQMHSTCHTTCIKADPSLIALCHSIHLNAEGPWKVDGST